ncbi:MAG: hypothetical protein ACI9X4_002332 [Glaciecola sp.]|jgi:hypothetical protein
MSPWAQTPHKQNMDTSNKRKWLGIGLLFVVIVAGGYVATMGGAGDSEEPSMGLERAGGQAPMTAIGTGSDTTLVSMEQASTEEEGKRVVVEEVTDEQQAAFSPKARGKNVIWIDGFVEPAEGTPLDETMEVLAKGKVFQGTKDRKEHRVAVAADGRFRVAVSADTAAARLSLISKYQYLEDDEVWLQSKGGDVTLKPKLGAFVQVQIVTEPISQDNLKDFKSSISGLWGWSGDATPSLLEGNRLELMGMPVGRDFSVMARAKGYARFTLEIEDLEPGKTTQAMMILKPESIVTGRLLDNRGEPVPEGRIMPRKSGESRWRGGMDSSSYSEVVDGDFEVHGLGEGDIALYYTGAGYSAEKLEVSNLRVGERRDGLVWRANKGLSLSGKVMWPDGSPARHVMVKLVGMSQRELAASKNTGGGFGAMSGSSVETDADGLFEMSGFSKQIQVELMAEGLPPGKQVPRDLSKIKARRFVRKHIVRVRIDKVLVGGPEVTMVLGEEQEPLMGRVEDDLGQPITTFRLIATPIKGKNASQKKAGWGTTKGGVLRQRYNDDEGAFEWSGIPNGDWSIEATASGYQKGEVLPVTIPSNKDLVLMLPRGARIFGKVVGPEDKKKLAEVRYAEVIDGVVSDDVNSVAATEQFGFSIANLAPGTYSVYAKEPTAGESQKQVFQVSAGEVVEDVVLKLPGPGRIEGSVHRDWWEDGLQVKLSIVGEGNNRWSASPSAKVRADGTFSVSELAPGEYTAKLKGNFSVSDGSSISSNPGPSETTFVASGQTSTIHFRGAPPGSVRLKGRVLRDGKGVSGYKLEVSGMEPNRSSVETISRANGAYSMILAGAGTYRVRARPGDGGSAQVWQIEVSAGGAQTIDMVLPSFSLTVVLGAQGGGAVPFELQRSVFKVEVQGMGGGGSMDAKSVEGSEIRFTGLAAGDYKFKFSPRNRRWGRSEETADSPSRWVLAGTGEFTIKPGETQKTVRMELRRGADLTGRVIGVPADPDMFLYVTVSAEENGSSIKWARVQNGEFSVSGLPEGDVWVKSNASGSQSSAPVKVTISYESPGFVEVPYPEESDD